MKKILSFLLVATLSFGAYAIPALHKLFAMKNSDGTTVMLYKYGDGHSVLYTTPDNRVVVKNDEGCFCYAQVVDGQVAASAMRVHDIESRSADEQAFVRDEALRPSDAAVASSIGQRLNVRRRITTASTADGLGKYGTSALGAVPSIGSMTIPVIMVQFSDLKFKSTTTKEFMTRFYNEDNFDGATDGYYTSKGSVKQYFVEQSGGLFTPTFEIVAVVTLSKSYSYYGANSGKTTDANCWAMVKEAVAAAKSQGVNFNNYKNASTNTIPNVSILYAGQGEATSDDENAIWPHEQDLGSSYPISGYVFGSYFVGNELWNDNLMGMGVFVHEFSHALGLPDFYDSTNSYTNDLPFGVWSVMDNGPYNCNAYVPVGYMAYERSFMGWQDIPAIKSAQGVSLTNPNDGLNGSAVLFRNPSSTSEYFILENIQSNKWSPMDVGTGLLLSRYCYKSDSWYDNTVNTDSVHKRAMVITADGSKISGYAYTSHLFGNGAQNILSLPYFNTQVVTAYPFYQIVKHADKTISFSFRQRNIFETQADNGDRYELVSDLSQLSANDSVVFVCQNSNMAMGTNAYSSQRGATNIKYDGLLVCGNEDLHVFKLIKTTDGKNWGFLTVTNGKNAYLGVSGNGGLVISNKADSKVLAAISFENETANVTFGGTYTAKTVGYNLTDNSFKCYESTGDSPICLYRKVKEVTPVSSVYADDVTPYSKGIYSVDGRFVGTDIQQLPHGIYIINGKKIVR